MLSRRLREENDRNPAARYHQERIMSLIIADEIVKASGLSEDALLTEIVILLFQQDKISLGKASELLEMSQIRFQKILSDRGICVHYDVTEFQEDLQQLRTTGWL
jgi:predicted HTH domain antitoxin